MEVDDQLPTERPREVQVCVSLDQNSVRLREGKKDCKAARREEEHGRRACTAERADLNHPENFHQEQERR